MGPTAVLNDDKTFIISDNTVAAVAEKEGVAQHQRINWLYVSSNLNDDITSTCSMRSFFQVPHDLFSIKPRFTICSPRASRDASVQQARTAVSGNTQMEIQSLHAS